MNYNNLAQFMSLVEAGGLSEASRRLGIAKSSLSRVLAKLEADMNLQLVNRNTRNFKPTEAGLLLYQECREHFFNIKSAAERIHTNEKELSGKLVLSAAVDLAHTILPDVITLFAKQHPNLQIDFRAEDRIVDLVKEGVDLALRMGRLKDSSLKSTSISHISLILVATPNFLMTQPRIKSIDSLVDYPYVSFTRKYERWIPLSRRQGSAQKVRVSPAIVANNPLVAKSIILKDFGIGLLPDFICYEEIKDGSLIRILPEHAADPSPLHIVWPAHQAQSVKVRAFVDFSKELLKKYFV